MKVEKFYKEAVERAKKYAQDDFTEAQAYVQAMEDTADNIYEVVNGLQDFVHLLRLESNVTDLEKYAAALEELIMPLMGAGDGLEDEIKDIKGIPY
jgi:hypothetical protein